MKSGSWSVLRRLWRGEFTKEKAFILHTEEVIGRVHYELRGTECLKPQMRTFGISQELL